MNMGMLLRGELLKTTRRAGARIALLGFAGICVITFTAAVRAAHRHPGTGEFQLPGVWAQVMEPFGPISMFIAAVVIIMLTANEFTWRTARQNVIDGLSKQQWFLAKALNALIVAAVFAITLLIAAAAFSATIPFDTFMRASDAKLLGAYLVGMVGVSSVAFLLSMMVRKDGGALGFLLVWASLGEAVVTLLLNKLHDGWDKYGQYLPFRVFFGIFSPTNWDAARQERVVAIATRMHRAAPDFPDVQLLLLLALGYIIAFVAVSYVNYMRRDL